MMAAGNNLYFTTAGVGASTSLYVTDGTATTLLDTFNPGNAGGVLGPTVSNFVTVNGRLFFSANDGISGMELWTSDGTPAGTVRVKDINTISAGSNPSAVVDFNGWRYFAATDTSGVQSLWMTDGTVVQQVPGPGGTGNLANPFDLTPITDPTGKQWLLVLANGDILYETDGTTTQGLSGNQSSPVFSSGLTVSGQWAYFVNYGSFPGQLWETDGTK